MLNLKLIYHKKTKKKIFKEISKEKQRTHQEIEIKEN